MKQYHRIILGNAHAFAAECFAGGFIGVDYGFAQDFSGHLPENWRDFNEKFRPVYLATNPGKSKITAGLACGMTWTVCKGIKVGDMVLCPIGDGGYQIGEVIGDYYFLAGGNLPHRRSVKWLTQIILKTDMSDDLRHSVGSIGAVVNITGYSVEIEHLLAGLPAPVLFTTVESVEDPYAFAMEKHLEDFLVKNWSHTVFGKDFEVFTDGGAIVGQQYPTDTGPIDILATSKDKKTILVIELKRGRASDVVVGQMLRYMGYVKDVLVEEGQEVRGAIIALEEDIRLRQALKMVPFVEFYLYKISFSLLKV
jgi:restriction system protein